MKEVKMGLGKLKDTVLSTSQYINSSGQMLEFSSPMGRRKGRAIERSGSESKQSWGLHK